MPVQSARLIIDASEANSDLLWATGFFVPDPCIFIQKGKKKSLILADLEYARAKKEARVHEVISYNELLPLIRKRRAHKTLFVDYVEAALKRLGIKSVIVPPNFDLRFADALRRKRYRVRPGPDPFFPERAIKTQEEVAAIRKAIRATERALRAAVTTLKKSKIKRGRLHYRNRPLTSAALRRVINISLLEQGYLGRHTIVAGGKQAADPHCEGHGPLRAHETIVMDVYPRCEKTGYHADITRTVCKGRASDKLHKMYRAVKASQEAAAKQVRHNVSAAKVHRAAKKALEDRGFVTERKKGVLQGFIHSTGHGLGLDIHEHPRLGDNKDRLQTGNVITLEPGLYYSDTGGIRIEDDVLVTRKGCEVLSKISKRFEIP